MRNFLFAATVLSTALLSLFGCQQTYYLDTADVVGTRCDDELVYTSEARYDATYASPELETYRMYVDTDMYENYTITALNVAKLAYTLAEAHEKLGLPNNDSVREVLSVGHFVIVEDDDQFEQLHGEDATNVGAFIIVSDTRWICWEMPPDAKWSSVIRANAYNGIDPKVIVHEMVHAVSWATYGYSDGDHSEEAMWMELNPNSVQQTALNMYAEDFANANDINGR